jgi:hypothetical protein
MKMTKRGGRSSKAGGHRQEGEVLRRGRPFTRQENDDAEDIQLVDVPPQGSRRPFFSVDPTVRVLGQSRRLRRRRTRRRTRTIAEDNVGDALPARIRLPHIAAALHGPPTKARRSWIWWPITNGSCLVKNVTAILWVIGGTNFSTFAPPAGTTINTELHNLKKSAPMRWSIRRLDNDKVH